MAVTRPPRHVVAAGEIPSRRRAILRYCTYLIMRVPLPAGAGLTNRVPGHRPTRIPAAPVTTTATRQRAGDGGDAGVQVGGDRGEEHGEGVVQDAVADGLGDRQRGRAAAGVRRRVRPPSRVGAAASTSVASLPQHPPPDAAVSAAAG